MGSKIGLNAGSKYYDPFPIATLFILIFVKKHPNHFLTLIRKICVSGILCSHKRVCEISWLIHIKSLH